MSFRRDPRDRRYPERLTASYAVSLLLHALFAILLFTVLASSSQTGATENVSGGEIITIESRTPLQVAKAPNTSTVLPAPHVPRIAPVAHAPLAQPQAQKLPQNLHILAVNNPKAPPNPKPIPQQSIQPAPQPTQQVFEPTPANELPAAPVTIPTVAPVAVAVKAPPTTAPSPAPTARATAPASPKPPAPTAAPTAKPATPAPPQPSPSAAPTAVAAVVKASSAPSASPAPASRASLPPAPKTGVPSPSPTSTSAAVAKTAGTAPSPGPKGQGSPGPAPGLGQHAAPARPIAIPPTPKPEPVRTARPVSASPAPPDINAKLRALLPNGPVTPSNKTYTPHLSLQGRMQPTPPPDVLAHTKYIYRDTASTDALVEMWVTDARKNGPTTMCTGWLVRYPRNASAPHAGDQNPVNGTQISLGGSAHGGELPPIVEGIVTEPCEGRLLEPYAGSSAPSP